MSLDSWTIIVIWSILTFTIPVVAGWTTYMVIWNYHRATVDVAKMYRELVKGVSDGRATEDRVHRCPRGGETGSE